ncbi:hypothetical protein AAF712_004061 [Marasmius tenuissimus]|uniref:GH16 domain-containing protein n=1 Tax=Marasmius tenuissimus TaxID=585030 RepID=A0ABR3A436_9AGAR
MKADSTSVVPPGSRGRDSIRITSLTAYDKALFVANISHMPVGCGTWPAFWTLSQKGPWPNGGEIDIIEGVHANSLNLASLHTIPQCTMDKDMCGDRSSLHTGHPVSTDCNTAVNYNQGCGVEFAKATSYGHGFNQNKGGYYILEKGSPIRVWFLPRGDPKIEELFEGESHFKTISTDDLPTVPDAIFPTRTNCDYGGHFDAHAMVFDVTLCGDWAGSTFSSAGCGASCVDFVDNNPQAFAEAYWVVDSVKVYTKDSGYDTLQAPLFAQGSDL